MKWDAVKDGNEGCGNQNEVKKAKEAIESVDVGPVRLHSVDLNPEGSIVGEFMLNFTRQIKKRIHNYEFKAAYNVGRTSNPYMSTRNCVVMMLEEELGVEIVVRGGYKPFELNAEADESDALMYDVYAATPELLHNAMSKIGDRIKAIDGYMKGKYGSAWRQVVRNGAKYYSSRVLLQLENEADGELIKNELLGIVHDYSVDAVLRGRHSGYVEPCLGEESNEPAYIHLVSKNKTSLATARRCCEDVIARYKQVG
ncbi:hypothetical protein HK407_09g14320 [Ordospora pajunii]|jgi:hypothetical protein|uniref:uncharacterized protein n=1 Tax=Ordospora pajunii TaxID=3039483 RepID=UPI002952738A|nr:uncharacterized protein HK407_09g14320 [Ordospora pajunii]KAH9411016.1 hypothetical protein HK407_09g14320 [Ordospora pajunii]